MGLFIGYSNIFASLGDIKQTSSRQNDRIDLKESLFICWSPSMTDERVTSGFQRDCSFFFSAASKRRRSSAACSFWCSTSLFWAAARSPIVSRMPLISSFRAMAAIDGEHGVSSGTSEVRHYAQNSKPFAMKKMEWWRRRESNDFSTR